MLHDRWHKRSCSIGLRLNLTISFDERRWFVMSDPQPPPQTGTKASVVFYDGHCGLCHRWVRYVLKHDDTKESLCFSPLQGDYIQTALPADVRNHLPDAIVVLTADGGLLIRSDAIIYILEKTGARRSLQVRLLKAVPRRVRDAGYRVIALIRKQIAGKPAEVCPVLPPEQRRRFLP